MKSNRLFILLFLIIMTFSACTEVPKNIEERDSQLKADMDKGQGKS